MSEANRNARNLFKPGELLTARKLNMLATEIFEMIEVGPGLTKTLIGGKIVIGLASAHGGTTNEKTWATAS